MQSIAKRTRGAPQKQNLMQSLSVGRLIPDKANPRKADQARMSLLQLSLRKLGFIMPVYCLKDGLLLSGHQRLTAAKALGISHIPAMVIDVPEKDIGGINILFNRATNDFSAFDTGSSSKSKLDYQKVIDIAEGLPDFEGEDWYANNCRILPIKDLGKNLASKYDKKATVMATSLYRMGVTIPIVVSESGQIVNGLYRLFAAKENGVLEWPVITIPDAVAEVALTFLNYLSMDYHVDDEFAAMLRYSAYRRPQNNRGAVPKAYRFWGNGCRTLMDRDSYTSEYWTHFRDIHGGSIVDFGAGLGKVAPFLRSKGIDCIDFEPYRIDPAAGNGVPSPEYSKEQAYRFLTEIADGRKFTSIFLASVLNSVPFPKDRMAVLVIVNALCGKDTKVYGTCRDISDFNYEYGGIRNANYFVFDSEPGVRVGDIMSNPKIQKFHTQEEAEAMFSRLWLKRDYWRGGNVFYFRAGAPRGVNPKVLREALSIEFDLPYADGTTMGLAAYAIECFEKRLGIDIKGAK